MSDMNFSQYRAALVALGADLDKSSQRLVGQMADVGLKVTKKNTPVSGYETHITAKGKKAYRKKRGAIVGGNLRRGWIKSITFKDGSSWESGYSNNVDYGLYVNNGHRVVTKGGITVGYVKGRRMLEQGIDEARKQSETLFRNEIARVKAKTGF